MYGTPTKNHANAQRSPSKFFESYNLKCLMGEWDRAEKENLTSGNKATGRKQLSPASHYKHIYKIIHTSTVLRASPTSAKKPLGAKLCSIVSLDCIENLNSKFDSAETVNLNSNCRNVGFSEFIEHMREDSVYAGYFETQPAAPVKDAVVAKPNKPRLGERCRKQVYGNMVAKLNDLLN